MKSALIPGFDRSVSPAGSEGADLAQATPAASESVSPRLDVVYLGDMRTERETAWRIAHEVRIAFDAGYSVGLLHVATTGKDRSKTISPAIDRTVREGFATPINPASKTISARLLIVCEPDAIFDTIASGNSVLLSRIDVDRVVAVADGKAERAALAQQNALLKTILGSDLTWAGTDERWHASIAGQTDIKIEPEAWRVSAPATGAIKPRRAARPLPVMGRIVVSGNGQWPESPNDLETIYPATGNEILVRVLGPPDVASTLPQGRIPEAWEVFAAGEIDCLKFLNSLDALVFFPGKDPENVPANLIARAMVEGIPTIVSHALKSRFGTGPIYAAPEEVVGIVKRLYSERVSSSGTTFGDPGERARAACGPAIHEKRLHRLVGPPSGEGPPKPIEITAVASKAQRRRLLFMSSNGIGVGHLTRLLAIARRMPEGFEPVFATMSQAVSIVEQAGYPVEHLPFHVYAQCSPVDWQKWFAEQLSQIIEFHDAKGLIFDGGFPYDGLLEAVGPTSLPMVWIRRAMWRGDRSADEAIRRQRHFDLVIEPGDVAEAMDKGATVRNRATVLNVSAVRLLDPDELLSREAAAARLGLDPARPAVLIQLGSGWNRDLTSVIDTALKTLSRWPEMQPVIADWLISDNQLDFWPGVRRISGFPLSKYYKAFDFTISAAGYNSFNEIISFGLPAIFVPNEDMKLDDQPARAAFAEENGAAFQAPYSAPEQMEPLIEAMKDEKVRWFFRTNSTRLAQDNGANDAAAAIARLIG